MKGTITDTTSLVQSESGSDIKERVLHTPLRITMEIPSLHAV